MDNREAEVEVIIDDKLSLCAIESVKFENNKILLFLFPDLCIDISDIFSEYIETI